MAGMKENLPLGPYLHVKMYLSTNNTINYIQNYNSSLGS